MGQIPRLLRVAAGVTAVLALVLAFEKKQYLAIGIVLGFACLLGVATRMHSRAAAAVRSFMEVPLRVEIWGAPLCGEADRTFRLEKVQAFGAGLLIWARSGVTETLVLIKVAQPRDLRQQPNELAIGRAKYVQVDKSTVPVVPETPALSLSIRDEDAR